MKKKKNYKFTLTQAVTLVGLIPIITATIGILVAVNSQLKGIMYSDVQDKLIATANATKVYIEESGKLDLPSEYLESMVEDNMYISMLSIDLAIKDTSIVNSNGDVISGCDFDEDVANILKQGKDYSSDRFDIEGVEYTVYITPCFNNGEHIGSIMVGEIDKNVSSKVMSVSIVIGITAGSILVLFIFITLLISKLMCDPMVNVTNALMKMSEGDLTSSEENSSLIKEISFVIDSQSVLHKYLTDIVKLLKGDVTSLTDANTNLTARFNSMSSAIDSVNSAVEEIAQGATSQANDVTEAVTKVMEMDSIAEIIAHDMKNLGNAVMVMEDGMSKIQDCIDNLKFGTQDVLNQTNDVSMKSENTNDTVVAIKGVIESINSIASQTNLLSLNASIEAARAGEAGRGFAVVADSIRTLAQQTSDFASEIKNNIEVLMSNSSSMMDSMNATVELTNRQVRDINETESMFNSFKVEVVIVSEVVEEVSRVTKTLSESISVISGLTQQLSAISEENAASTEETSATMMNLNSAVQDCNSDTKLLQTLSAELSQVVKKFKV